MVSSLPTLLLLLMKHHGGITIYDGGSIYRPWERRLFSSFHYQQWPIRDLSW